MFVNFRNVIEGRTRVKGGKCNFRNFLYTVHFSRTYSASNVIRKIADQDDTLRVFLLRINIVGGNRSYHFFPFIFAGKKISENLVCKRNEKLLVSRRSINDTEF